MAKQILVGIREQDMNEVAHCLMIYLPFNEELYSYTDNWLGELYENKYPLVSKGMWSAIIDLHESQRRGSEESKIECVRRHFAAISDCKIQYGVARNYQTLYNLVTK